ncbi:MAG: hypothetical protein H6828_06530 [Planctomycetes bacterium]|nr:hypothetical protein [Planctomycetota bacterium]
MPYDSLSLGALGAAALVALVHTAAGPDHYLPFVMLARARRWSEARTLVVTALCGLGHVGSSLALAALGLAIGAAVADVEGLELARGAWAGQAMLVFGLAYCLWGVRRAVRQRRGLALHAHDGDVHLHGDAHGHHHHAHVDVGRTTTFWALFAIFVLGPCEPLIPIFLLPASEGRWALAGAMAVVFSAVTLVTMGALVLLALRGIERLPLAPLERWTHALAGGVIALTGAGMCLGL